MRCLTLWNGKRPTASFSIVAVFVLWLWVMAVLPALAFFNVAWGEGPSTNWGTCELGVPMHECPGDCPPNPLPPVYCEGAWTPDPG